MADFKLKWNGKQLNAEVTAACKKAVINGAKNVAIDARMNVPVDEGNLLFSIKVTSFEKKDVVGAYVSAGGDGSSNNNGQGDIAGFVELGTPGTVYKAGPRKGPRKPIQAKPYLRPALKKNYNKILVSFRDKLK